MIEGVQIEDGEYGRRAVIGSAWSEEVTTHLIHSEIVELELKARGEFQSVGNGFRKIGKQSLHFCWRLEVTFGIARQQASGSGQRVMMTERRKGVG